MFFPLLSLQSVSFHLLGSWLQTKEMIFEALPLEDPLARYHYMLTALGYTLLGCGHCFEINVSIFVATYKIHKFVLYFLHSATKLRHQWRVLI